MWLKSNKIQKPSDINIPKNKHKKILGMDISYKDIGKGDPVFCFPPWPSSSFVFLPLSYSLKKHCRLISIDLPGWGGYSSEMKLEPTMENYAQITEEFIRSFGYKKFSFIGYSFGGLVSQIIINNGKTIPKKVVFASSMHSGKYIKKRHSHSLYAYKLAKNLKISDQFIKSVIMKFVTRFLPRYSYFPLYKDTRMFKRFLKEDFRFDTSSIMGTLFSILDNEYLSKFKNITESMVIYADQDPEFIKAESIEIAHKLDVEPIVIDKADHNHFAFEINKSADLILNFLLA